jgi:hypothetical protein
MSNDYVHVFKQFTFYKQYLQGGPTSHAPNTNELLLKRAQGSNDPTKLVTVVANFTSKSSFTNHLLHLEGEEVLGSIKQPTNYPPSADEYSHHLDHANFSR